MACFKFSFWMLCVAVTLVVAGGSASAQGPSPYTIANYPVEATASDAVTAKKKAIADGERAAFRSLLKRIVPVTVYSQLEQLNSVNSSDYVSGMSVRSEQNSSTEYLATLDFEFNADATRQLLRSAGVPFVDEPAPSVTVVPVFRAALGKAPLAALGDWGETWRTLDLANTITPLKVAAFQPSISSDTLKALEAGEASALRLVAAEYGSGPIVFAFAQPDKKARRLNVSLVGRDGSGPVNLKRRYPLAPGDLAYAMEYAAVISLGVIEGRWKATRVRSRGGVAALSGPAVPLSMQVQFDSVGDWYKIQDRLRGTDGVSDLHVGSVSARSANISLRFPGGGAQLANVLARNGLSMRDAGGVWILRPSY